jgi:predicted GIY-YIG superfamily endonuclease
MEQKLKETIEHASLTCNRCLKLKPVNEFHICRGRTTGRQGSCKICTNKMTAEYRQRTNQAYWRHKQGTPYVIYTITNPEGQAYIGYTGTKPNVRFAKHKAQFKFGKCKLVKLHESFIKHGVDNHTFEVIEKVATRLEAMSRETILILELRTQGRDLNTNLSTFRIGQYDKKTKELIKEWDSITEVSKHFGKSRQYFYAAATRSNRRGVTLGFLWKILPFKDGSYYDFQTNIFTPAIENK